VLELLYDRIMGKLKGEKGVKGAVVQALLAASMAYGKGGRGAAARRDRAVRQLLRARGVQQPGRTPEPAPRRPP
jgi:hypothetical protein